MMRALIFSRRRDNLGLKNLLIIASIVDIKNDRHKIINIALKFFRAIALSKILGRKSIIAEDMNEIKVSSNLIDNYDLSI